MKETKSSKRMDVCEICGQGIPVDGLTAHLSERHATILAVKEDCQRRSRRAFVVRMIPGILLFFTISLTCVAYLPVQDQYLLLLALVPVGASGIWGALASEKEKAAYKEALRPIEFSCYHCGTSVSRDEYPAHVREVHSRIHKWLVTSCCLLMGIPFAVGLSTALISLRYLSVPVQQAILWAAGAAVVTAMTWALTVEYLILPMIEKK